MIGIIGAMKIEVERINALMEDAEISVVSGIAFTKGTLYGKDVVTAVCGVGKVFAALCAEAMILKYRPEIIINTGVAGTLTKELSIGDVAVATAVVQHDMDTSALGDPVGLISGINKVEIPSDEGVGEKIARCVEKLGVKVKRGVIASGDQFVNRSDKKTWIRERFGAIACEMEGAAIGQAAFVNEVKFAVIRAISDGDGGEEDYNSFLNKAARIASEAVKGFVKEEI